MITINRNTICLSSLFACLAVLAACHQDIITNSTSSATDDEAIFGTSTTSDGSDTEVIPTTSAGDPTGGGIDPTQFCKLHPGDDYPGFVHVCSGWESGEFIFDYYGDDPAIDDEYIVCFDLTEPPNLVKPEGYVFTCQINLPHLFPTKKTEGFPGGHQVDACCLQGSPFEAIADYCRVDLAEELCREVSFAINDMRKRLPPSVGLAELNHQLENLSKYIADSDTQTACSQHLAKGFVDIGNVEAGEYPSFGWEVKHPQALDPEVGWPMLRDLRMFVWTLDIKSAENAGVACSDSGGDAVTGVIEEGAFLLESYLGSAHVNVSGTASFRRADCRLDSCEFRLEAFSLEVDDFEIGAFRFTDVSVVLSTPTSGLIKDDAIGLPENQMHLTATFHVEEEGVRMFDGAPMSVELQNHGVAHLRLLPGSSLALERLDVINWPVEMSLVNQIAP